MRIVPFSGLVVIGAVWMPGSYYAAGVFMHFSA